MWKFVLIGWFAGATMLAQPAVSSIDIANLREDVRGLTQRVGELALRVEQLERENTEMRSRVSGANQNYVTMLQLNAAVDDLNRTIKSAVSTSKAETLQHVATQIEKLANQTNAALDALAKGQAVRPATPAAPAAFSEDYAKEGTRYTVQKGDTLAVIAKKTGARVPDIVNANKISDPSHIIVGQTLFIPNPPASAAK
jgi:LysM repeat protein